jgi:DNA-binding CsgD family transcriptional regulator
VVACAYAVFAHGAVGLPEEPRLQIGIALIAVGGAVGLLLTRTLRIGAPAEAWIGIGLLVGFAAWCGITLLWSVAPDRTWEGVNRALAYVLVVAVALLAGSSAPRAIERVAGGESLIDPRTTGRLLEQLRRRERHEDPRLASLTSVERRMLELIADGLTNRQIAHELLLAEKTVKNHVSAILSKLGMARRTEAAVFAVRAGATCGS